MARDREIACIHYICEGECDLGKDGTFRGHCQTCKTYRPKPGGNVARPNLRKEKNDKFMKDKRNWD